MFSTWTKEEEDFLRENYPGMTHAEIAKILNRTTAMVKGKCFRMGLINEKFYWKPEEIEELKELYPNIQNKLLAEKFDCSIRAVYGKASQLGIKKSAEFLSSEASGRITKYSGKSTVGRFKKGQTSWIKGKKGIKLPGSEKGWFKKGQSPTNKMKVGTIIQKSQSPYLVIKIADPNKWQFLQRYIWEQNNGAIPKGYVISFKDKNPHNCQIENLEMITKAENQLRNSIMRFPPELRATIRTLSKLKKEIKNAQEQK